MDIKDQDTQLAEAGFVAPDTGATPLEADLVLATEVPAVSSGAVSEAGKKSPSPLQESLRRLRRDKIAMASLIVILLCVIIPLIGPLIYQHICASLNRPTNGLGGPAKNHTFSLPS